MTTLLNPQSLGLAAAAIFLGHAFSPCSMQAQEPKAGETVIQDTHQGGPPIFPKSVVSGQSATMIYRYQLGNRRMPPGIGTYDVKPACEKSVKRRSPVYSDTKELDDFDMTFYDYNDGRQKELARAAKTPTVPYLEGDLYNPYRDKDNLQQGFGRFFRINCLPTRVHYIYVGNARVEEHSRAIWLGKPTNNGKFS